MGRWGKTIATVAGVTVGSTAAAVALANGLWNRATGSAVRRLLAGATASHPEVLSREQFDALPEPVARYFAFALTPGQSLIRSARIAHQGEMRLGGFESGWRPFTSMQHVATHPPGFVWDATLRMMPLVPVRVRDAYLEGTGSVQARLAALIPVADQRGGPELAAASLQRYLAEAPWFPTALLPRPGLTWEEIDSTRARATLADRTTTVSLQFQFAPHGAIEQSATPARYREVAGAFVPTPWTAAYRDYTQVDGMQVPLEAEVAWILPEGRLPVWRGQIRNLRYQFGH